MYKIISKKDYKVSKWSGGVTTQMYIYPEDSSYERRNFLFRLSSATVEDEISTFTKLDGIHRILMVLKGETTLIHRNNHKIRLMPYEVDEFEGDWDTQSCGKVEDFNVMLAGCNGSVKSLELKKDFPYKNSIEPIKYSCWQFFYSVEGDLKYTINDDQGILSKGDLLVLNNKSPEDTEVSITNEEENSIRCINVIINE